MNINEEFREKSEKESWRIKTNEGNKEQESFFIDADAFVVREINLHSHIFRVVRDILSNMEQTHVDMGKSWSNIWSCNRRWLIPMFVRTSCMRERKRWLQCSFCQHSSENLVLDWTGERDDELGRALQFDRMDKSIDSWGLFLDRYVHQ